MTKINDEKLDREQPRVSAVVDPGQSHISIGMMVL
jgi:hypothetical protein